MTSADELHIAAPVRMALYLGIDTGRYRPLLARPYIVVTPRVDSSGSPYLGRGDGPAAERIRLGRLTEEVERWALQGECPAVGEDDLLVGLVDADLALGLEGGVDLEEIRVAMLASGAVVRPVVVELVKRSDVLVYPGLLGLLREDLLAR